MLGTVGLSAANKKVTPKWPYPLSFLDFRGRGRYRFRVREVDTMYMCY